MSKEGVHMNGAFFVVYNTIFEALKEINTR
jgi:hypothetical protein